MLICGKEDFLFSVRVKHVLQQMYPWSNFYEAHSSFLVRTILENKRANRNLGERFFLRLFYFIMFYWGIVDIQYCIGFRCTTLWIGIYILYELTTMKSLVTLSPYRVITILLTRLTSQLKVCIPFSYFCHWWQHFYFVEGGLHEGKKE